MGKRYGMLTVLSRVISNTRDIKYACVCDCGQKCVKKKAFILNGITTDCGCKAVEKRRQKALSIPRQARDNDQLHKTWQGMKQRCNNPNHNGYKRYGARGIKLCDEWNNSFHDFLLWAKESGWKQGLEIDRIDNNKGYNPDNCRWVTHEFNMRNRDVSFSVTYQGKTCSIGDISRQTGILYGNLYGRIVYKNMTPQQAVQDCLNRGLVREL